MEKIIGSIWGLLACALLSLLLASCAARKTIVQSHATHDTVWMVQKSTGERQDSVLIKERVEIVPKLIRIGDSLVLHTDTNVLRVVQRNIYQNRNVYTGKGHVVRDTVFTAISAPASQKSSHRRWWVFAALAVALIVVITKMRLS